MQPLKPRVTAETATRSVRSDAASSASSARTRRSRSTTRTPSLLKYFITDRGKLVPRRLTGNCAKHQREISTAVNRARMIALMPFAVTGS